MDFLAGTDVSLRVLFEVSGQPKVPDSGSVTYTLRGDSGSVLLSDVPATPAAASNAITITIPAINNATTFRYEYRTILTTFAVSGAKYMVVTRYRLLPFLNHASTGDDVRGFLGVAKDELPDTDIDFPSAYFTIETLIGQATLANKLAGLPAERRSANGSILYTAVLAVIPSLKLRTAFSQTDGPLGFQRFRNTPDFEALYRTAQDLLSAALDTLNNRETSAPTLLMVSTPTDVITGV